jgi:hypothetical protein
MAFRHAIVLVCALSGCKSMGGFASGLGHAASGLGHVASGLGHAAGAIGHVAGGATKALAGVGHVAAGVGKGVAAVGRVTAGSLARATPALARGAGHVINAAANTLAVAEDVAEAAVMTSQPDPDDPTEVVIEDHSGPGGPLIDDHDPCGYCPEDLACDQCVGFNDAVCRWTPADAHTRCESSPAQ